MVTQGLHLPREKAHVGRACAYGAPVPCTSTESLRGPGVHGQVSVPDTARLPADPLSFGERLHLGAL